MISDKLASPQIGDGTSGTGLWLGPALQPPGTSLPEMPDVGWTKLRGAEVIGPDAAARAKTRSLERAISCPLVTTIPGDSAPIQTQQCNACFNMAGGCLTCTQGPDRPHIVLGNLSLPRRFVLLNPCAAMNGRKRNGYYAEYKVLP